MTPSPNAGRSLLALVLVAGLALSAMIEVSAFKANGGPGFPLDDPWIHLQFAKNLHDYGSYSYFRNLMVTSGSTSPLYTFLLAGGFFLTHDEMILSYVLGVLFLLLGGILVYRLSYDLWGRSMLAASGVAFLFLVEPRLQWAALSGMETTLFIFLLLASFTSYRANKSLLLGISSGLLLWARPEAVIFVAAIAVDAVYHAFWSKSAEGSESRRPGDLVRRFRLPLILFLLFGAAYAAFNLLLSGSVMPNTYAAKLTYYAQGGAAFPSQVFHYLVDRQMTVFSLFLAAGIIAVVVRAARRERNPMIIPFAWSAAMFLAYWKNLPYLYQEGRYLMPVLPFVLLLGVDGMYWSGGMLKRIGGAALTDRKIRAAVSILTIVFVVQFAVASWTEAPAYAEQCRYISDRQVRTARWIRDHLPEGAVVGTHDIGAIAFYSGRRIADMVGLVSPEMISGIGRYDRLLEFLTKQGTTHLAVLRNWFDVSDQNPLFLTDEQYPEIMEVFAFEPSRTHFAPADDQRLENVATYYLSRGNPQAVAQGLTQYFKTSPGTARLHALAGGAFLSLGNRDQAAREFEVSAERCPGYLDAQLGLSEIDRQRGNIAGAVSRLESVLQAVPTYSAGCRELSAIYGSTLADSTRAREVLDRCQRALQPLPSANEGRGE